MHFFTLLFWTLAICGCIALVLNLGLVVIILKFTKSSLGFYKWVLIVFAIFESCYALVVFVGTPIHLVTGTHWIVISYGSILTNTPLYFYGPAAYCVMWFMWIFFVVFLFVYRYVVVCHNSLQSLIKNSHWVKFLFFLVYIAQIIYSALCGAFWCTRMPLTDEMKANINATFGISDYSRMGYMLFGFRAYDNSVSVPGTWALMNHYLIIGFSGTIIFYCCYKIYSALRIHQNANNSVMDMSLQKQLFYTLLVQTSIPFLMYHVPTMICLTFPLWPKGSQLGSTTPLFSVFTTIPKILDPIVIIIGIKDYRQAALRLLTREIYPQLAKIVIGLGLRKAPQVRTVSLLTTTYIPTPATGSQKGKEEIVTLQ